MIAEGEEIAKVLARILIRHEGKLIRRYHATRLGEQAGVEPTLHRAGLFRRHEFGPRKIGRKEGIGDDQTTLRVAIHQMVPARHPEIVMDGGSLARGGRNGFMGVRMGLAHRA